MLKPVAIAISAAAIGLSAPVIGVQPGDSQVDVSWKAPTSNVDYVVIEESTNGGAAWKAIGTLPGTATHYLVDGLQNGTNYWFRAHWMIKGIPSAQSQAVVATPNGQPDVPTNLISIAGDSQVSLQWDKAADKDRIVSYAIEMSPDGGITWKLIQKDTGTPATRYLVDQLTNGTTYSFRVAGIASNGIQSEWSDSAQSVVGVLRDDSFELNGEISGSDVNLTWSEPDLKSEIDTYRIEISTDGGMTWSTAGEVDGGTTQVKYKYVLGGALYRIIATSISGEFAISVVDLVQNLADAQDSNIDQAAANANSKSNGAVNPNLGQATLSSEPKKPAIGGTTTKVNGGIGTRKTLPKFDIAKFPKSAEGLIIAGLALLGLLSSGRATTDRREDEAASLDNIDYAHPETFDDAEAQGDRSKSWRWPSLALTLRIEKLTHAASSNANRFSPLLGRIFSDGNYLRAMYGALSISTWVLGLIFGALTVLQTGGEALPPQPVVVIALVLLGVLDAGAAFIATIIIFIGTAALGGFDGIPAIRTSLGLSLIFLAPALIASAARPIRRQQPNVDELEDEDAVRETQKFQWERAGDMVLAPLLAAFAVRSMVNGLPALAGLALPIANSANAIAILTFIFILIRYSLEDGATKNYPLRLALVESKELHPTFGGQIYLSIAFRLLLFVFVALPFMGMAWQLFMGAALFIAPTLISTFAKDIPTKSALYRFMPGRFPKFAVMLYIGAAYSAWVSKAFAGPNATQMAFFILSIPGFILSLLSILAGRGGDGVDRWYMSDRLVWVYRIGAIFLTATSLYTTIS